MRAVLDPNVLISSLLSRGGAPAEIVRRWVSGEFELVVSELLLAELEQALAYSKLRERISAADADRFVSLLQVTAYVASDPPEPERRSTDPGDDYLVALAEQEQALLVSGDRDLLELADRFPIRSPARFLAAIRRQS